MSVSQAVANKLTGLSNRSAMVGIAALAASLAGAFFTPDQFFRSYLIGYLLWVGVPLGSLALLMLHHLVGGEWGWVSRRALESATRTLPFMAVAFLPVVVGLGRLYVWADAARVAGDELLEHKAPYLNESFFLTRSAVYFVIWIGLALLLNRWSREQDEGKRRFINRFQLLSGIGLVLFALTATLASVDWVMSLEPHWFSTIYGLQFIVGQVLAALALMVLVLVLLSPYEPFSKRLGPSHFHAFGNLLLAFVMLWAYLAFSQYLITWSGNLPEEIPWYLNRTRGGWQWVGLLLVVFHFAVPFFLLLLRTTKRKARALARVAGALLVLRLVDLVWMVEPAFVSEGLRAYWMDIVVPVGVGGIWLAIFFRQLKAMPLMPVHDPRFAEGASSGEALEHGAH